ncbi:hypothetical protein [Spirosoma oryzicola]|uniref:hypothetical protein n=1 Tax=Spirosoma oryzicola TaxID=2898794 RepID=UPI001E288A7C|nr:hypothetical protein [Spirosoma oryzicola]UHG93257.1 hypothetical protein LQ777_10230 [Spirosoma oryzicola]
MKLHLYIISFVIFVYNCQSKEESVKEDLVNAIRQYDPDAELLGIHLIEYAMVDSNYIDSTKSVYYLAHYNSYKTLQESSYRVAIDNQYYVDSLNIKKGNRYSDTARYYLAKDSLTKAAIRNRVNPTKDAYKVKFFYKYRADVKIPTDTISIVLNKDLQPVDYFE